MSTQYATNNLVGEAYARMISTQKMHLINEKIDYKSFHQGVVCASPT